MKPRKKATRLGSPPPMSISSTSNEAGKTDRLSFPRALERAVDQGMVEPPEAARALKRLGITELDTIRFVLRHIEILNLTLTRFYSHREACELNLARLYRKVLKRHLEIPHFREVIGPWLERLILSLKRERHCWERENRSAKALIKKLERHLIP